MPRCGRRLSWLLVVRSTASGSRCSPTSSTSGDVLVNQPTLRERSAAANSACRPCPSSSLSPLLETAAGRLQLQGLPLLQALIGPTQLVEQDAPGDGVDHQVMTE